MKILIDARFYGLEHAGLGRYTINLIRELAKLDKQSLPLRGRKNEYIVLLRKKHMEIALPKNWRKVKVEARHYWFKEQAVLPLVIRKYRPDIVHFLHSNLPVFFRGKFVVTIHDLTMYRQGMDATTLPLPLYYAKRIPFKMVFRKAVYDAQTIITPSKAVKDQLVESFHIPESKVAVTYEGVEAKRETRSTKSEILMKHGLEGTKYFLYVGNVYPHKNIKRAIEAIAEINKNQKTIYFVVVCGRGVFRHRLEKHIKKLKAEEFVKVLDFIDDRELSVLYKNALAFLFPSRSEGFGLPGLEAIQNGTLLLASNTPVFKEIYKDKAMYFDPLSVESIVRALKKAMSLKKEEREEKITDAKKLLKEYSWEKMARETLKVYQSIKG